MRLSDFDYELPEELIAQGPLGRRDASRLMVLDRKTRQIEHRGFTDLPDLLQPRDRLVLNDTRVVPSRLFGVREGFTGKVELLLVDPTLPVLPEAIPAEFTRVNPPADTNPVGVPGINGGREPSLPDTTGPLHVAITRPARKLPPGTRLRMGTRGVEVTVAAAGEEGRRLVRFPAGFDVLAFLEAEGHLPLPPYIRREDDSSDRDRYQTVFAREEGAIAAPTAGLHFTPEVLEALDRRGVRRTPITLHVGPGTFVPVTAENPADHRMEAEFCRVPPEAAAAVNATSAEGGRIVAVGTTVVRTLESLAEGSELAIEPGSAQFFETGASGRLRAGALRTRAFIRPPYRFRCVDALVTNFHLPRSTLLMLVAAFAGLDLVREAYAEAVRERYRFYSYGDAMLIL